MSRLHIRRLSASAAERNVIELIERDPQLVVGKTIRDLAELTFTSPSTIVRLCRRLGCGGYRDFQRELVREMALTATHEDVAIEDISSDDGPAQVVRKVVKSDIYAIEATSRLLDTELLGRCAELLVSARTIDVFGVGASLLIAHDLVQKFMRTDKECHVYDDWHNQLLCANNMHPEDIAIVVSYSGLTSEMLEIVRRVHAKGCEVIAITRVGDSELARAADHVLTVAAGEPLVRSGAMASRIAQLMVVDALYAAYVTRDFDRCSAAIRKNYIEKK